jgi:hypothetical protein
MTFLDRDIDMNRLALMLSVFLATSGAVLAGGHHECCADCGYQHGLRKVCRWVCEEVEEKVPAWECECEDVVIPGKSPFCIQEACADPCQDCVRHGHARWHLKKVWGPPCTCRVKTVKALMPIEKTVKKKVWKPVIETVCDTCCAAGGCADGMVGAYGAPPTVNPMVAPQDNSVARGRAPGERETSLRRGFNAISPIFMPASRRR